MSGFEPLQCTVCGGELQVEENMDRLTCPHCGAAYLVVQRGKGAIEFQPVVEERQQGQAGEDGKPRWKRENTFALILVPFILVLGSFTCYMLCVDSLGPIIPITLFIIAVVVAIVIYKYLKNVTRNEAKNDGLIPPAEEEPRQDQAPRS